MENFIKIEQELLYYDIPTLILCVGANLPNNRLGNLVDNSSQKYLMVLHSYDADQPTQYIGKAFSDEELKPFLSGKICLLSLFESVQRDYLLAVYHDQRSNLENIPIFLTTIKKDITDRDLPSDGLFLA